MFQVQGLVESTFTKQKTSKAGRNFTIHYIVVDGHTISTGFRGTHNEGEMVNIAVEQKYGEYQEVAGRTGDGLPPIGSAPAEGPKPVRGSFGGAKGKFPIEPTDGQMSIVRQSSLNRAVELVRDMVQYGIVENPANKDEYLHLVLEVALVCTDFGSGQDIMQLKKAQEANKVVNQ